VSVVAPGNLTINGLTNSVDSPLEAPLVNEVNPVTSSADIVFAH
jgi:hypothetical protein